MTSMILAYTAPLATGLQKKTLDIVRAYQSVKAVSDTTSTVREQIDEYHSEWFKAAVELAQSVHVEPSMPRTCSRQTHRDNTPSDDPSTYTKRTVTIPFLDELQSQFKHRFSSLQQRASVGLSLVPSVFLADKEYACSNIKKLSEDYSCDMTPTFINGQSLNAELDLWSCTVSYLLTPYYNVQDALKGASKDLFPNLHQLLRLVCTFPITSCETERSVSALRRLKTYLRSTMGQERMSSIALIH